MFHPVDINNDVRPYIVSLRNLKRHARKGGIRGRARHRILEFCRYAKRRKWNLEKTKVIITPTEIKLWGEPVIEESKVEKHDFGWALRKLREGCRVTRTGWNGPDQYLELQVPDQNSKMTLPYIYIRTVQGDLVPWLASQTDLLSENDWELVDG